MRTSKSPVKGSSRGSIEGSEAVEHGLSLHSLPSLSLSLDEDQGEIPEGVPGRYRHSRNAPKENRGDHEVAMAASPPGKVPCSPKVN